MRICASRWLTFTLQMSSGESLDPRVVEAVLDMSRRYMQPLGSLQQLPRTACQECVDHHNHAISIANRSLAPPLRACFQYHAPDAADLGGTVDENLQAVSTEVSIRSSRSFFYLMAFNQLGMDSTRTS